MKEKLYYLLGKHNTNIIKQIRVKMNRELSFALKGNEKFHNIHKGKRCFIIGSGPSVNNVDFSRLSSEYTFTVNHLTRFKDFEKLNTNYHLFGDERIFRLSSDNSVDEESLFYLKKLYESSNDIHFFAVYSSKRFFEENTDLKKINYFYNVLEFYDGYRDGFDITKSIPWFPTCIDYCIFLAMYMGFSEIYPFGCECTGFSKLLNVDALTYGYTDSVNERNRIEKQIKKYGASEELQLWADILKTYDYLEKYSKSKSVKIVNCTDGGILESFERMSLDDVLKKS